MTWFLGCIAFIFIGCAVSFIGGLLKISATAAAVIIVFLCALSLLVYVIAKRKTAKASAGEAVPADKGKFITFNGTTDIVFFAVFVLLLLIQIVTVILYSAKDASVLANVKISTKIFETGRLESGNPIMNLYGITSYIAKVHPLKLIFTYLPAPLILVYYLGIYELLKLLCDDRREVFPAMCFTSIMFIWGFYCRKLVGISLLLSWFSGKCFILYGLCVAFGILLLKCKRRKKKTTKECDNVGENEEDEEYLEEWDMNKHKIINARNLAIALVVFAILVGGVILVVNKKINDLHDATVNLEADLNSRCSVYEFTPGEGDIQGYLIKGSDGNLTVIGGGSEENSDSLSEFITKYGTNVSNWYVYSDNEADTGALGKILQGNVINVEKVYILDRKEVSDFLK